MHDEARQEAGAREEIVGLVDVAVDEDVLPGDQHLVHDEDGVVLVEPRGERIVERAAHRGRRHLVGGAADEFHARRIGRDHEDDGEILVLQRDQPVMGDEGVVGQHRAGRHHLGAGDDDAGIRLLLHMRADVRHLVRRPVAVDRGMDDGVVDEGHALLAEAVPALGVVLIGIVEIGIGAERRQERRLVVGRAADPAIGDARPFGDGVAARRAGPPAIFGALKKACVMPPLPVSVGISDPVFALRVVQRVVEAGDHAGGVAEGRDGRSRPSPARRRCRPRARRAAIRDIRRRSCGVAPGDVSDGLGPGGEGASCPDARRGVHALLLASSLAESRCSIIEQKCDIRTQGYGAQTKSDKRRRYRPYVRASSAACGGIRGERWPLRRLLDSVAQTSSTASVVRGPTERPRRSLTLTSGQTTAISDCPWRSRRRRADVVLPPQTESAAPARRPS